MSWVPDIDVFGYLPGGLVLVILKGGRVCIDAWTFFSRRAFVTLIALDAVAALEASACVERLHSPQIRTERMAGIAPMSVAVSIGKIAAGVPFQRFPSMTHAGF